MTKTQAKRAIIFILILCLALFGCDRLLFPFSEHDTNQDRTFYEIEENSIDVAAIGTSLMMVGFSPLRLYDQTGITSYNRANSCQSPEQAWLVACETFKTQKPKVLMLAAGALVIDYDYEFREPFIRRGMDYRKWSKEKLIAAEAISENSEIDDTLSFIFPLIRYHSRWGEVIVNGPDKWWELAGYDYMHGQYAYFKQEAIKDISAKNLASTKEYEINEDTRYWYGKIFEMCKENGTKILFVGNKDMRWTMGKHDVIAEYAEEVGADFIDYNISPVVDEVGLSWETDYYDHKHQNVNGSIKFTDHLGQYLIEHYGLSASEVSESEKKQWQEDIERFKEDCANNGNIEVEW